MSRTTEILIGFHLDNQRFAIAQEPSWDPVPSHGRSRGVDRSRIEKIQTADLEWDSTLWMPTRLRLNGIEFLHCSGRAHPRIEAIDGLGPSWFEDGHSPCPWQSVPVVVVAYWGVKELHRASQQGEGHKMMADQGDLIFRVHSHNGRVEVQYRDWYESEYPNNYGRELIRATVPFFDFLAAWEAFSEEVRTQFLEVLPELTENEEYGPWFREGIPYLKRQPI